MTTINNSYNTTFQGKFNTADLFKTIRTRIKNKEVIESIRNTHKAIKILRTETPEEIFRIIQKEATGGNPDLVAQLNGLMSKSMAEKVYKNLG